MIALTNRRSLLTGIAAAMTTAAVTPALAARPRRMFFDRIGRPIGLQCYTLGAEPKADLEATFARLAAIGRKKAR